MSITRMLAAAVAAIVGLGAPAGAQTTLFGQPAAPEAQPAAPAEAARSRPKPKPRGPTPARSLTISNASGNALTSLQISGGGKVASLSKPLAPNARTTLRLPALKTCIVTVAASFEGAGEAEARDYNVCREKTIRFTD